MCYCVITNQNSGVPVVISENNPHYPNYLMSGNYEVVTTGTKRECQSIAETMLNEICID